MILFLRTSDIGIDSRLRRYCRALAKEGIEHRAAYWDRGDGAGGNPDVPSIRFVSPLGYHSRLATALRLIRVNIFFMATLWRLREEITLVHAVDLDSVVTAWLMKRLADLPYIYDVYDHYADSRGFGTRWRGWLEKLERLIVRDASLVILADAARVAQHPRIAPGRCLTIENVPSLEQSRVMHDPVTGEASKTIRIGYLGTFEAEYRGLEDLLEVVETSPDLELEIAGAGAIRDLIASAAKRCDRIIHHAPMPHEEGLAMLARCDIVSGLYYSTLANHRYAAPNKYFEHLLVGRPLLTSIDTPPGAKVQEHDTGWAVRDGVNHIRKALDEVRADPSVCQRKGRNAAALWQALYSDYFARVICGEYVARVRLSQKTVRSPTARRR